MRPEKPMWMEFGRQPILEPQEMPRVRQQLIDVYSDEFLGIEMTLPIRFQADLLHISRDMSSLATHSTHTLSRFDIGPEHLFSGSVLIHWAMFDSEWAREDGEGTTLIVNDVDRRGAHFMLIARDMDGDWHPTHVPGAAGTGYLEYGAPFSRGQWEARAASLIAATLLLSQQKIASRTIESAPRQFRRREEREGRKAPDVNVIGLRSESRPGSGSGGGPRDHDHRWLVRGHWRNQPVGPGRKQLRPTWVTPHVKGPEDKPLLIQDKVYSLHR